MERITDSRQAIDVQARETEASRLRGDLAVRTRRGWAITKHMWRDSLYGSCIFVVVLFGMSVWPEAVRLWHQW